MSEKALIRRELARRELARRHYADYLALVHGNSWIQTRLSRFLAQSVQDFLETPSPNAYEILLLETPPQHGKSMTLTETLPSWWLMRHPTEKIIIGSYNEDSAERFSRRNRDKLRKWGAILTGVEPGGMNRATEFELSGYPGRLISRGIMSGVTGHSANLFILDDPVKNREEADSPVYREKLWGEWLNSFKSRLAAHARVIIIMTPWHEDDIAARILRTENHVRLLRLPVEAEENDPLGRSPGEPLCPELGKDAVWLAQFKQSYLSDPSGGARAWNALYMCSPRVESGHIVRREWLKFYASPPHCAIQIISVDAAFKAGESNDFTAITAWGKSGNDYYLLDCVNEHLTFSQTLTAIRAMQKRYPEARAVLIEDKANGSAIIDVLRKELFCIPVTPGDSKMSRVQAVAPAFESGHVYFPRRAPWIENYISQWLTFPAGAHDDMVDSSTQALAYLFRIFSPAPELPGEGDTENDDPWDIYNF